LSALYADLIEAGLNEGAGRLALAALWALFEASRVYWRLLSNAQGGGALSGTVDCGGGLVSP
jgi:hypothetical protein